MGGTIKSAAMTTIATTAIAPIFFAPNFLMKEAFSLVFSETFSCSGFAGVIADSLLLSSSTGLPHFAQKAAASYRGVPHFVQNLGALAASVTGVSCRLSSSVPFLLADSNGLFSSAES